MIQKALKRCFKHGIFIQNCFRAILCISVSLSGLTYATDLIVRDKKQTNKVNIILITPKESKKGLWIESTFKKNSKIKFNITKSNTEKPLTSTKKDHIITVGAVAFHQALASRLPHSLILATYITKSTYRKVLENHKQNQPSTTAIFSDIPLDKQIHLGKILIPQSTHVTTLTSDYSIHNEEVIRNASQKHKLIADLHFFEDRSSFNHLFNTDLFRSTFILALADPNIFNSRSLKYILIKGYRNNIGVIGPNKEAVEMGSLASIYFSDNEFSRVAQNSIVEFYDTGIVPKPKNLKYFNFIINNNVAKSMNITIPHDSEIQKALAMHWLTNNE